MLSTIGLALPATWPESEYHAGIDIFRVDDAGMIVEHWGVLQAVPETSANDNGVF
ncbi:MAG: hypothetical protein OEV40_27990 [Acidimicrobiia bacterium]|nr:hypothetical protein [Acidimicrobiia bacterium]